MSGTNTVELPNNLGTLRPTLGAAKNINTYFGGFVKASEQVQALNLDAMIAIVAFGLDEKPRDVEDDVWAAGTNLVKPLSEFLILLANGGNPITKKDKTKTGEA